MPTRSFLAKRYELHETIGKGGMGVVHRATDHLTGHEIALKQVLFPSLLIEDDENTELRLALANEFKTLAKLHHPHIINVIDYGFHDMRPFFTMDYLSDAQTIYDFKTAPLLDKATLFIDILQALDYLHQRNILHCDIKPSNILYSPQHGVKLLDFGLAQNMLTLSDVLKESVAGTVEYLAPEILQGEKPTIQSDLFAFGVVLCEALTGQHPFHRTNITQTISAILRDEPNLGDLSDDLKIVLTGLLDKNPRQRYPDAQSVLEELCYALAMPIPQESSQEREYVLQSPAFVGRETPLNTLLDGLHELQSGKGQFWLVGGESGVGKSRLLDELRTQALVEGIIVLRGQGVEGGGLPYQLWRNVVHRLILSAHIDDLEASILKEILPDIDKILNRTIRPAPRLDGTAGIKRLALTLADLFRKQSDPILLVLEDLQWTVESLDVLHYCAPLMDELPVFIIGSYRIEEDPSLPHRLPEARVMTLERLHDEAIRQMSESILGDIGTNPTLNNALIQETEGNPLFVIEALRMMANEAGGLRAINKIEPNIVTGGIVRILQNRIAHLPEWVLPTLKLAAILGRKIDIDILRAVHPHVLYEQWLGVCVNNGIIESVEENWRFSHDKLREATITTISPNELQDYHRQIAQAIQTIHGNAPEYAPQLAYHWRQAGNLRYDFEYSLIAGKHALQNFVLTSARQFFEHALDVYPRLHQILMGPATKFANLLHDYGVVLWRLGDGQNAKPYLMQALKYYRYGNDTEGEGWVLETLGTASWRLGEFEEARTYLQQCIAISEGKYPLLHAYALNRMGTIFYTQGDKQTAFKWIKQALPIARQVGELQILGHVVGNLGMISTELDDLSTAKAYLDEALSAYQQQGNIIGEAHALTNMGHLAYRQGNFEEASQYYRLAIRLTKRSGDIPTALEDLAGLAQLEKYPCDALRLCGLVIAHPASMGEAKEIAQALIDRKHQELGAENAHRYLVQGNRYTLTEALNTYSL